MLRCTVISSDISHPLRSVLLKSGHRLNSIYCRTAQYRSFHVYQHVTSFSHMRGALVGRRTTVAGFHMQNMCDVGAKTLEYRSKYTHILNPTVREDIR